MYSIEAESPGVAAAIGEMIERTCAAGGSVHDSIRVRELDGSISMHSDAGAGTELVKVPVSALVPVELLGWASRAQRVTVNPAADAAQRHLVDLAASFAALYDACGKVAETERAHPLVATTDPAARASLGRLRTRLPDSITAFEAFIGTRKLGMDGRSYLLPVVDFFNHHRHGAALRTTTGGMLTVAAAQRPGSSTGSPNECFVSYGPRRDPLDLLVVYGFADPTVPFARSAPVSFDHPDLGLIEVRDDGLHQLDLPSLRIEDHRTVLGGVLFHRNRPERLVTALELVVDGLCTSKGWHNVSVVDAVTTLISGIASENLDALADAEREFERLGGGTAATVVAAIRTQRQVITDTCAALGIMLPPARS